MSFPAKLLLLACGMALIAAVPSWACGLLGGEMPRLDLDVGVVAIGAWGEPYRVGDIVDPQVVVVRYQSGPTLAEPQSSGDTFPEPYPEGYLNASPADIEHAEVFPILPGDGSPVESDAPDGSDEGLVINLLPTPGDDGEACGPYLPSEHVLGYNTSAGGMTWIPASDDDFGWFSWEHSATLGGQQTSGLVAAMNFHFLNGPVRTEMPPRLFDFVAGYQRREWIRPNFGWDFAVRIGVYSDFEGSADEAMRFPSHLVTFWRLSPTTTVLAGIDYLDWDELPMLPVFGLTWIPTEDYRFDIAFPRPRAAVRIMESDTWLAIGGELAGGTWAIERDYSYDDNVTYQDMRLYLALETFLDSKVSSALELGYVFERDLEYRSGVGNYSPNEAMMIRWTGRH